MEAPQTTLDSERSKRDTDDIKRTKEKLRLAKEEGDKKTQASACDDLARLYIIRMKITNKAKHTARNC